jgi:hypothetical protein
MFAQNKLTSFLFLIFVFAPGATWAQEGAKSESSRVDALAAEIGRLKEAMAIPATEELRSHYGLGPAASKVYGKKKGLSLGGYGEFYFARQLEPNAERSPAKGDIQRFITYVGYKYSKRVVMNTELEFEHASTSTNPENGKKGSVSVEFSYIDLLYSPWLNVRAGLMLMPVGIVNEMHEPTTFRGNLRPGVEKYIIPTTWREAGVGIHGKSPFGLSYKLYVVNGMSAKGFSHKNIRGSRQKGNHFVWEDTALVARIDYKLKNKLHIGSSFYHGGSDHDPTGELEIATTLYELHAIARHAGAELRILYANSKTDGAEDLSALQGQPATMANKQFGYYVEASYDLMPLLTKKRGEKLRVFTRVENMKHAGPTVADGDSVLDPNWVSLDLVAGLEYNPHKKVVLKGEFSQREQNEATVKEMRLGAGFIF